MTYYKYSYVSKKYATRTNCPFGQVLARQITTNRLSLIRFGAIFKNVYTIRSCAQLCVGGLEFSKDRKGGDRVQTKSGV